MSYAARRAEVLAGNFAAFGVTATVTRPAPDDTPIATTLIWLTPQTEDAPVGTFVRREARRVVALLTSEVPTCPLGTAVVAPDETGGTARGWRVDGFVLAEAEHVRVSVVEDVSLV